MVTSVNPILETVKVEVAPERAFLAFHEAFGRWWPASYTYSGEAGLHSIGLGAEPGDLCTEIGPNGFRVDWGRMVAVEIPRRLLFLWQIAPDRTPQPDPAKSSEVEVLFSQAGRGSEVQIIHRAFERCGGGGAAYRDQMASEHGWRYVLQAFAAYANRV